MEHSTFFVEFTDEDTTVSCTVGGIRVVLHVNDPAAAAQLKSILDSEVVDVEVSGF